jgi:hypothetical protein
MRATRPKTARTRKTAKTGLEGAVLMQVGSPHRQGRKKSKAAPEQGWEVKFGAVTVKGGQPDMMVVSRNVKLGNTAFNRAAAAIASPGVTMTKRAGVPVYRAASDDPKILIRTLNGKVERGRIVGGKFVPFG